MVACSTAFRLLEFELASSAEIKEFPELHPDWWPGSLRVLFRWPHGWVDLVIYGVFRRAELAKVPIVERFHKGKPHIFWWETDLLTTLSGSGRIVVLPPCPRSYRRSTLSIGQKVVSAVSTFDLLLLGTKIKLILIGRGGGCRSRSESGFPSWPPHSETSSGPTCGNPTTIGPRSAATSDGLAMLERVARERSDLIDSLNAEIGRRTELACERGLDVPQPGSRRAPTKPSPSGSTTRRSAGCRSPSLAASSPTSSGPRSTPRPDTFAS